MDRFHAPGAGIPLGSFDLPDADDDDAAADPPKSCLLDIRPFFGKDTNATTAVYRTRDPDDNRRAMAIQATLFVARPPRVSYVLAWSTGTYFVEDPLVVATDGEFVLLRIAVSMMRKPFPEYYIYQPAGLPPSLHLIPQPSELRVVDEVCAVGLLSHAGGGGYHVAALTMQSRGAFQLYLFSSKTQAWTFKEPLLLLEDGPDDFIDKYVPDKVITVGSGGVMAFVDLCNGILICNILEGGEHPVLRYLPLPLALHRRRQSIDYPLEPRDITIVVFGDTIRIKFVELHCSVYSPNWKAVTWNATAMATSPWCLLDIWRFGYELHARDLLVADGVSIGELLPEVLEFEGRLPLGCLFIDMPMLSLHEDNVVCFLAKQHHARRQVWAIAVNMEKMELQGVNRLQMGRRTTLFYSTISSHLNITAAASGVHSTTTAEEEAVAAARKAGRWKKRLLSRGRLDNGRSQAEPSNKAKPSIRKSLVV